MASISKVCEQQYDLNPPFSCAINIHSDPLTILSLVASNTMTVYLPALQLMPWSRAPRDPYSAWSSNSNVRC